ncbi:hypothetical protein BC332_06269 [Capsicum chinense]|nr:hypothetical protein BC332_06269 [Capsicum chinense]
MMKNNFFFFRSSTNDAKKTPSLPLKSKEVSSWRSVSLSSGSFYDSGSGEKNFTDLRKSPHGHSKKVHPKKSGRDSSQDLSVPVLIHTIRRLTNEKVQMDFEVSIILRNQVVERASTKEKASILQAELDSQIRRLEIEKNEQIHGNLDLSHSVDLRKKLYVGRGGLLSHTTYILKRAATLLENGKYQASENKGYAGHLELVNEVGHSACFDENHERSTHLSKNGKYQAKNTGYDGNFKLVNEVGDSARFEESFDGSNNGDIEVTKCGREGSSNGDIEATEYGGEDSIIFHYGRHTEQYTNSSDVLQSVPKDLEAEAKFNLNAGNIVFNDPKPTIEVKEKLEGQDSSIKFSSNSVDLSSYAHTTEKDGSVSSEPRRSSSSKVSSGSKANVLNQHKRKRKKQRSNSYGEISISKQLPCLPSTVNLVAAKKKTRRFTTGFRSNRSSFSRVIRQQRAVFISNKQNIQANPIKSNSSSKESARERLVSNSPRPRTSDCIKRNKDFKAEDKTKVVARRTGNNEMRKDVRSMDLSHSTRVGRLAVGVAS